jgi:hypothetical protein
VDGSALASPPSHVQAGVSRPLFSIAGFPFPFPPNGELLASGSCDPAGWALKAPLNFRMLP